MNYAWSSVLMNVIADYDDVKSEIDRAQERISRGQNVTHITVEAEVDIEEALDAATADQLRDALGREETGYTQEQLDAIRDCFAAAVNGDGHLAFQLLPRIFNHGAQLVAAEQGLRLAPLRRGAA